MSDINKFMLELKQLCDTHGVRIVNAYDESVYLSDMEGNQISEDIDFDSFTAETYVEPVRDPNIKFKAYTLEEGSAVLRDAYGKTLANIINNSFDSSFNKLFKKE